MSPNVILLYSDQCPVQPSSERLPPAADGTNTETHSQALHTILNGMFSSNPSSQSSGNPMEEEVGRGSQRSREAVIVSCSPSTAKPGGIRGSQRHSFHLKLGWDQGRNPRKRFSPGKLNVFVRETSSSAALPRVTHRQDPIMTEDLGGKNCLSTYLNSPYLRRTLVLAIHSAIYTPR